MLCICISSHWEVIPQMVLEPFGKQLALLNRVSAFSVFSNSHRPTFRLPQEAQLLTLGHHVWLLLKRPPGYVAGARSKGSVVPGFRCLFLHGDALQQGSCKT